MLCSNEVQCFISFSKKNEADELHKCPLYQMNLESLVFICGFLRKKWSDFSLWLICNGMTTSQHLHLENNSCLDRNPIFFFHAVSAKRSHNLTFATLWTVAHQAWLSMRFSRQEYWCRLPFPSPGDVPDPQMKPAFPASPALAGRFFTTLSPVKPDVFSVFPFPWCSLF